MPDAVVIGAGPNGLVAANLLADEGWDVVVLEAQAEPGGAVRSGTLGDGFKRDLFSAFYPLAVASPVLRSLELDRHGLRWRTAPLVIAHPTGDGVPVVLSQDLDETAASLDADHPGDGDVWRQLYRQWERLGERLLGALLHPFPPVADTAALAVKLRQDTLDLARFALLPVRRLADEHFGGRGARMLLAANALHADLGPEAPLSGFFGWLLCSLGQQYGYPVPEGGAGALTAALVDRLESRGGRVLCATPVERVVIRSGRAVAVRTRSGDEVEARRAVLADVGAPALYLDLVGTEHLPDGMVARLERFQYDNATVKLDWALDGPIPWRGGHARRAGTVHLADGIDHLSEFALQLAQGVMPARPFLVIGQMTTSDPTRSPPGTESAWAYTDVPQRISRDAGGRVRGVWDDADTAAFVARMEDTIEAQAPGFCDLIRERAVLTPRSLTESNANLVGGSKNGGTAQLHQQLVFRPVPGMGGARTPIRDLYLASASAHPGGGVHGACGANAARAAMAGTRRPRQLVALAGAAGLLAAGRLARRA